MNAPDVLKYGHVTVIGSVEGVPFSEWNQPGVCGVWSVKDIIAHLSSYEFMLNEIFNGFLAGGPTPTLNKIGELGMLAFNDYAVEQRKPLTAEEILGEYTTACEKNLQLAAQIPSETFSQNGTLPWYGAEYDLDDFIVYTFYGHKREHTAQIDYFRDHVMVV